MKLNASGGVAVLHRSAKMKLTPPTSISRNQVDWWSEKGVVYFIAAGNPPVAVKIGVTKWSRAKSRIGACQTGNHEPLELIGVIPFRESDLPLKAAEDEERTLHERFRALQRFPEGTRGHEWFTASADLLSFIQERARPPEEFGFARFVSKMTGPKKRKATNKSPLCTTST